MSRLTSSAAVRSPWLMFRTILSTKNLMTSSHLTDRNMQWNSQVQCGHAFIHGAIGLFLLVLIRWIAGHSLDCHIDDTSIIQTQLRGKLIEGIHFHLYNLISWNNICILSESASSFSWIHFSRPFGIGFGSCKPVSVLSLLLSLGLAILSFLFAFGYILLNSFLLGLRCLCLLVTSLARLHCELRQCEGILDAEVRRCAFCGCWR